MGLPMLTTLGKETKISLGRNSCNILARESFDEEQLKKKSLKSSSPHWKAQEKVRPLVVMEIQCWI
jgi:hypothetical protein